MPTHTEMHMMHIYAYNCSMIPCRVGDGGLSMDSAPGMRCGECMFFVCIFFPVR